MKIDWTKAPAWAKWLAVDEDGDAYWFENKPYVVLHIWDSGEGDALFAFSGEAPKDFTQTLYERPVKAELEIDWTKAPVWAKWLAVDLTGSAYWYRDCPKVHNRYVWCLPEDPDSSEFAFHTAEPEDFTQALYERPSTNEEITTMYIIKSISAVRIQSDPNDPSVEISEGQWRIARELVSLCDPDKEQWPKIKVIRIFRAMHPDVGLRDAEAVIEAAWQERHAYCS